jgi:DNA-binding CsgD family transcriptional regulator/tetratricopeptide (TPR) repeat protein
MREGMLVGRDSECRAVEELLAAARDSRSGALVVRGEAGIGKSALLTHAVGRAEGMRVLTGIGVEAESELPFAGIHQLLWPVLDRAEALPPVQAAALHGAFGLSADRVDDRFLVSVALLGVLTAVADDEPLLCVVDDAHWLDSASAEALVFVARRLQADPVALLVAAREGEARRFEAPGLPELALGGLDERDAVTLLDAGAELPAAVRDELVRATGGNPLALHELPAALTADQRAGRAPLDLDLPLTEGIERAFLARVLPLGDDARRLLLLAAADDTGDPGTVLRAAQALEIPSEALDGVERAGLLLTDGVRLRFRHPLLRSAVYRAASFGERRASHEALAAALDGEANADRAAWHRAVVAMAPDDAAADALAATADRAQRRGGHAAAARALERAADLDSDPQRRTDHLLGAATAAVLAGHMQQASGLLDGAEPGLDNPLRRARAAKVRGHVEVTAGRPREGHFVLAAAAREVLPLDRAMGLELLGLACVSAAMSGEMEGLARSYQLAASVEPDPDSNEQVFLVRLLGGLGHGITTGDTKTSVPLIREALTRADKLDDPRLVEMAGSGNVLLGDWEGARRYHDRAIRLARERGALGVLPQTLSLRAMVALWQGFLTEAAEDAGEAVRLAEDIGAENARALPMACLAWIAAVRGDEAECERLAEAVLGTSLERGLAMSAGLATWALAQLDVALGRWEAAVVRLISLLDVRPGFGHPVITVLSTWDRVEAASHVGRPEVAEQAVALLAHWVGGTTPAWGAPVLADCRAISATTPEEAAAHFEAAIAALDGARPLDRARIHLHYGEHLRRAKRRIDARTHLRAAVEAFDRLGAAPWADRARRELRATGETARKRDLSPLAQLTPQELQVARLVSEGATNKAVAAQLFVSPKTVEYHLRKVFDKLGIASRGELIRIELGERPEAQLA